MTRLMARCAPIAMSLIRHQTWRPEMHMASACCSMRLAPALMGTAPCEPMRLAHVQDNDLAMLMRPLKVQAHPKVAQLLDEIPNASEHVS